MSCTTSFSLRQIKTSCGCGLSLVSPQVSYFTKDLRSLKLNGLLFSLLRICRVLLGRGVLPSRQFVWFVFYKDRTNIVDIVDTYVVRLITFSLYMEELPQRFDSDVEQWKFPEREEPKTRLFVGDIENVKTKRTMRTRITDLSLSFTFRTETVNDRDTTNPFIS